MSFLKPSFRANGSFVASSFSIDVQPRIVIGTAPTGVTLDLAPSGATIGTYSSYVVDLYGRIISASNLTFTGDVTGTGSGNAVALTLAAVPWGKIEPAAQQLPLGFVLPGKPATGASFNLVMGIACTIPANLAGTVAYFGTKPTAAAVFTLTRITSGNVSSTLGTITLNTTANTAITLSTQSAVTLSAGDVLQLTSPTSQDATLADIGITILAAKV